MVESICEQGFAYACEVKENTIYETTGGGGGWSKTVPRDLLMSSYL
jgi:hypothetical protein